MRAAPIFGAVILAAGRASRMGTCKALLPLAGLTALERLAAALRGAGLRDIVAVTGHHRQEVSREAARLGLLEAHNPDYALGMFTSVKTGAAALASDCEAFFVLPVDCPLVGPEVMTALIAHYVTHEATVIYPSCSGHRGHPPLIDGELRGALRGAAPGGNLKDFLLAEAALECEVEMDDASILLDMDTMGEYERLNRLAGLRDEMVSAPSAEPVLPGDADIDYLLRALEVEDRVVRHCRAVAAVATALAGDLASRGYSLNVGLVRSAAFLHDLAKGSRRHAASGEAILSGLGFPAVGRAVGSHMVLADSEIAGPDISEAQLVYLADKLVVEDVFGTIETRTEYALQRYGRDEHAIISIRQRMDDAARVAKRIETALGRSIADVLAEVTPVAAATLGNQTERPGVSGG